MAWTPRLISLGTGCKTSDVCAEALIPGHWKLTRKSGGTKLVEFRKTSVSKGTLFRHDVSKIRVRTIWMAAEKGGRGGARAQKIYENKFDRKPFRFINVSLS
jgi:hypothetical protein